MSQDKSDNRGFAYRIDLTGRLEPLVAQAVVALGGGDVAAYMALLSPALLAEYGAAGVAETVRDDFLPYFAGCIEVGGPTTVSSTADPYGNEGLLFYKFALTEGEERRPFAIWVVEEAGLPRIAGLLPGMKYGRQGSI